MNTDQITALLGQLGENESQSREQLFNQVYPDLMTIARNRLAQGHQHSIDATDLVHESYLKLSQGDTPAFSNRTHFFAFIAKIMRHLLIDRHRSRMAVKRQAGQYRTTLSHCADDDQELIDWYGLDRAIEGLSRENERAAQVVELKYFMGLTTDEIAECMAIGRSTVTRLWVLAKAWLTRALSEQSE